MRLKELLIDVLESAKMSGFNDLQGDDAGCFGSCQQHSWLQNIAAAAVGGEHGVVGLDVRAAGCLVVETNELGSREPHGFGIITWPKDPVHGGDLAQDVLVELDDGFYGVHIDNPKHSLHVS